MFILGGGSLLKSTSAVGSRPSLPTLSPRLLPTSMSNLRLIDRVTNQTSHTHQYCKLTTHTCTSMSRTGLPHEGEEFTSELRPPVLEYINSWWLSGSIKDRCGLKGR